MRSLLDVSHRRDSISRLADWVEINTLFRDDGSVSSEDLIRALVREGDGLCLLDEANGEVESGKPDEVARNKAVDVFDELASRADAIGNDSTESPTASYPFTVDKDILQLNQSATTESNLGLLYLFLLAITRASMESTSRRLDGIDPTLVFERLCSDVVRQFWGGTDRDSGSLLIGTGNSDTERRNFPLLIDQLCEKLGEGGGWKKDAVSPRAGDGGLDIVVWRRFRDDRNGALVGFAQCKTGDNWGNFLGRHNPVSICSRYLTRPLVLEPLPIYMVPCRVEFKDWDDAMIQHRGLLFDRCRITRFGTKISDVVLRDCQTWFELVIERERKHFLKRMGLPSTATKKKRGA